ncbi:R3H domain-containing protein 2-like [Lolium rigidum]|uniref:R3H domain-containing protein 2-like n=1 Tax=Lolium rigidum TaxID=89674 RepID=UPI001F5D0287|nr:R3H domain-containing protein 2-like [Lolium rigidum]
MEAAEDAAAAPESWETADLDGAMSRLLLSSSSSSSTSARRVASSPDLADEGDDHDTPPLTATQTPASADDLVAQVDQFLREALEKPRERLSVLRMEQDILKFIHDPRQAQFEFQGLPTSYLRLAAHRLAQHYFLQSIAMPDPSLPDGTSSRIILRKTSAECRLPTIRLADIPVNLPQEDTSAVAAKVAIKQRPQKNHHGGAGAGANLSKGNLQKSVEERKEEYNKARARIFSTTSGGSDAPDGRPVEEVILPNTLHRSTSLELNSNTRYAQVSEPTLERSLTSTSSSSRSNRSRIDKEPPLSRGRQGNNRVAIFRDRDSERKDPDYDRSYDRYMQRFDPGFGFNGGAYTIQPLYAPAVTYNTEFPQLGSPQMSPVAVEQPHPMAQHMPGPWSPAQSPNAIGYRPADGVMPPYSPGQPGAPVRSSVFMHASQQYAMPSRPGVSFVHPQDSMRPFAQTHQQQQAEASLRLARPR